MATHRQTRVLTLSMVVAAHLIVVWLVVSSPASFKAKTDSLQLLWITRPAPPETAPEPATATQRAQNTVARHRSEHTPAALAITPPAIEENHATAPTPDWAAELQLAAKDALAKEPAQKRHEHDFAHAFPTPTKNPPQFAWDHAATHRVEAIPGGGILINLNDNCVLLIFPLPFVGCGIGKRPANGNLFINDQ
jgi:hypothetical protein